MEHKLLVSVALIMLVITIFLWTWCSFLGGLTWDPVVQGLILGDTIGAGVLIAIIIGIRILKRE